MNQTHDVLQFKTSARAVYDALSQLPRTGWVRHCVHKPESVMEHTEAVLLLAKEMWPLLREEEKNDLLIMLEVHDWPEALCGDEVILEIEPNERRVLKAVKFDKERSAMERICSTLKDGEMLNAYWLRFELSDDPAACFARQLDKYQALEKASEYERAQNIPLFDEFYTFTKHFISHPLLLARVELLRQQRTQ
jgi:5'-deoxynucleotidase YfbR-like HD superfamily hydrolase